jgi:hypothetical protein
VASPPAAILKPLHPPRVERFRVRIDFRASQEADCLPGGRLQPIQLPARQSKGPPRSGIARGDPEVPAPSTGRGWAGRFAVGHHLGEEGAR